MRKRVLTRNGICRHLDLGLPRLRSRGKRLLFEAPSLLELVAVGLKGLRHQLPILPSSHHPLTCYLRTCWPLWPVLLLQSISSQGLIHGRCVPLGSCDSPRPLCVRGSFQKAYLRLTATLHHGSANLQDTEAASHGGPHAPVPALLQPHPPSSRVFCSTFSDFIFPPAPPATGPLPRSLPPPETLFSPHSLTTCLSSYAGFCPCPQATSDLPHGSKPPSPALMVPAVSQDLLWVLHLYLGDTFLAICPLFWTVSFR